MKDYETLAFISVWCLIGNDRSTGNFASWCNLTSCSQYGYQVENITWWYPAFIKVEVSNKIFLEINSENCNTVTFCQFSAASLMAALKEMSCDYVHRKHHLESLHASILNLCPHSTIFLIKDGCEPSNFSS